MNKISIVMATLMVFGVFAMGFALAETENNLMDGPTTGGGSGGAVTSVTATEVVSTIPTVVGDGDFEDVIDELQANGAKRFGFFRGTVGEGWLGDTSNDHLALVRVLWVRSMITSTNDVEDIAVRTGGRIRVGQNVYKLDLISYEDDSVSFNLLDKKDGDIVGSMSLDVVETYNEGHRKIWEGKIETPNYSGEATFATITRTVRKGPTKIDSSKVSTRTFGGEDGTGLSAANSAVSAGGASTNAGESEAPRRGLLQIIRSWFGKRK